MRRRKFLQVAGSATGIAALAGCSALEDTGTNNPDTPRGGSNNNGDEMTDTPEDNTTDEQSGSDSPVQDAVASLSKAQQEFDRQLSKFGGLSGSQSVDVRTSQINKNVNDANTHLNTAEANGVDETTVESLRSTGAVFKTAGSALDSFGDGYAQVVQANQLVDNGQFKDAGDVLQAGKSYFADANNAVSRAQDELSKVDQSVLEEYENLSVDGIKEPLNQFDELVAGFSTFAEGYRHIALGLGAYTAGIQLYKQQSYSDAIEYLNVAADNFDRGYQTFAGATRGPSNLQQSFSKLECQGNALNDSSELYAEAAQARQNGNTSMADQKESEAEQAANRCD